MKEFEGCLSSVHDFLDDTQIKENPKDYETYYRHMNKVSSFIVRNKPDEKHLLMKLKIEHYRWKGRYIKYQLLLLFLILLLSLLLLL